MNYNHPDLADRMWNGGAQWPHHGRDYQGNDDDPLDEHGHGTLSAGIVAGTGKSGLATGVAPQAKIMALRTGTHQHDFWSAFEFAAEQGAQVVSMSISWDAPDNDDPGWRRACETLLAVGVLHANAAGNRGKGSALHQRPVPLNIGSPGNCPPPRLHPAQTLIGGLSSVITCGETDKNDAIVDTSGRGPAAWEDVPNDYPYNSGAQMGLIKPDLCAPGGVESCYWKFQRH